MSILAEHDSPFGAASEDLFGVFGVLVRGNVGEAYILPLPDVLVARLTLHVEAHHQLVDDHANDGAQERCKNGHQEPAISSSGTLNRKKNAYRKVFASFCAILNRFCTRKLL